jgi:CRP/FNR family transcriptional regulator, cyclic AMP receptor protein
MLQESADMAHAEPHRGLEGVGLVTTLGPEARHALERRCVWRSWAPGSQIIDRETLTTDLYFIVRGRVRVLDYSSSGTREVIFDDIGAGGHFGELAAIDGEPRSANVVAVEPTETAMVPGPAFLELLFDHPEIGLSVMRRLSEMVRQSTVRIMDLSTRGANNRIYAELLRLAKTGGGFAPNTAVISPIPVHSEIAARVSTTRETVARALSDLSHRNLMHRDEEALVILDLAQLTTMVQKFKD